MDEFEKLFVRSDDTNFEAKYEASCHCGTVRYHVSSDPVDAKICHCTMCQKAHGAPFGVYSGVRHDEFEILSGQDDITAYQSSADITRTFCRKCGATLQFIRAGGSRFGLAVASLDTPFNKPLDIQIYTANKAPWWPLSPEPVCYEEVPEDA